MMKNFLLYALKTILTCTYLVQGCADLGSVQAGVVKCLLYSVKSNVKPLSFSISPSYMCYRESIKALYTCWYVRFGCCRFPRK